VTLIPPPMLRIFHSSSFPRHRRSHPLGAECKETRYPGQETMSGRDDTGGIAAYEGR
jgi:hypothetical protein